MAQNKQDIQKLQALKHTLDSLETSLNAAKKMLSELMGEVASMTNEPEGYYENLAKTADVAKRPVESSEGKVIEGLFDGENMVAPDGRRYPVPANYASKSKLVAGDSLKLTISPTGQFIYKQIRQAERRHIFGILSYDQNRHVVIADGKRYRISYASVTYYKVEPGDEIAIVIPADEESPWAAIESVISRGADQAPSSAQINEAKQEVGEENPLDYKLD